MSEKTLKWIKAAGVRAVKTERRQRLQQSELAHTLVM